MSIQRIGIQSALLRTFVPGVLAVIVILAVIVYNLQYSLILEGFNRKLIAISSMTGAMIDPEDHDFLLGEIENRNDLEGLEEKNEYVRNVIPMQRIRKSLNLTYLYTQVLGGEMDVVYVLDSSEGDEHSPIGSEDDLPDETVNGLRLSEESGDIYVSPVEYQDQWGLLKTAAAPVYDADGKISGTAGADVDIQVIETATQNALFVSTMIGVVSILACVVVTWQIMRRVASPLEKLRQEALRIAADDYRIPDTISRPFEAAALRDGLADITRQIKSTRNSVLSALHSDQHKIVTDHLKVLVGSDKNHIILFDDENIKAIWICSNSESLEDAFLEHGIRKFTEKIRDVSGHDFPWKTLSGMKSGSMIIMDRAKKVIHSYNDAVTLRIDGEDVILSDRDMIGIKDAVSIEFNINNEKIVFI